MKNRFTGCWVVLMLVGSLVEAGAGRFNLPDVSRGDFETQSIFGLSFGKYPHPGLEVGAVKWVRFDFDYGQEQSRSEAAFGAQAKAFDEAVARAEANKIMVLGILNPRELADMYQPGMAAEKSKNGVVLSTWTRWVHKVVSRYKGRVKYWEICNEPNNWKKPEAYTAMLKAGYLAGKQADPSALFGGFSTASVDLPFFEFCLKAGAADYFDFVTIHPYQWSHSFNEQLLIADITSLENLLAKYNCSRPIWISEIGWPTHPKGGSTETSQGEICAQVCLTLAGLEKYKAFWYTLSDWPAEPMDQEGYFGMFHGDVRPKPAFYSYYVISKTLSSARSLGRVKLPKDFLGWHYLLKGGREAVSVWRTQSRPAPVRLRLEGLDRTQVEKLGMDLSRQTLTTKDGWAEVTVGSQPVILVYPSKTQWKLALPPLLAMTPKKTNPMFITASKPPALFPGQKAVVAFGVANFTGRDVDGVASLVLPREWKVKAIRQNVTAKAGEETVGEFVFDVPRRTVNKTYDATITFPGCRSLPITLVAGSALAIEMKPLNQALSASPARLTIVFANQGSERLAGRLEMAIKGATIGPDAAVALDLGPGQNVTVTKDISELNSNEDAWVSFTGEVGSQRFDVSRHLDSAYIGRAKGISVDGILDDWGKESGYRLDRVEQVQQIKAWWSGPEDLSAKVMARWDERYFYLAADVTDDVHCQRSTGGSTWMEDGFQIAFEADGKYGYEFCLAHTSGGSELYALRTISGETGPVKDAVVKTRRVGNHTYYETAIPWSAIRPLRGEAGKEMRFSFILNENDGTTREGYLECRPGIGDSKSVATWYCWRMGE